LSVEFDLQIFRPQVRKVLTNGPQGPGVLPMISVRTDSSIDGQHTI
jgi:hypothetical protein